jgi:hypothetical protein
VWINDEPYVELKITHRRGVDIGLLTIPDEAATAAHDREASASAEHSAAALVEVSNG